MKIVSIEPTPSPNSMKLNMDETLPQGQRLSYSNKNAENAPDYLQKLLAIPGVVGCYHAADFIAIDRHPKSDWQPILAAVREKLGVAETAAGHVVQPGALANGSQTTNEAPLPETAWGEVKVLVQTFRSIPMQVRVSDGNEEKRAALPERFAAAAMKAGMASPNLIRERKLEEQGSRYGELAEILEQVVRELDAAYDQERLDSLVEASFQQAGEANTEDANGAAETLPLDALAAALRDADWKKRYAALERIKPTEETIPLLVQALSDPQMSIRRLATVYLGDIRDPQVLPYLFRALKDDSVAVRRTAGDTLSDIGDPAATPAMAEALGDPNKLVRWRAARFLYEVGDERALPALRNAQDDAEFEVRMQVKMALERIEGGTEAIGSVWQQMTNRAR